ncbi:hydrolase [Clostridia bacterium OttesenSCG-928-O13]|nr:hydrolase [Clostridia bacterium OttesenSCG-928-O13]
MAQNMPEVHGRLRGSMLQMVPEEIYGCTGISIHGKRIKSILFSTDVSVIRNTNADAIIAVYPFTPQSIITRAIMTAADVPVLCGVGGGLTGGDRVSVLAIQAEEQGAAGVVLNAPTPDATIVTVKKHLDIPIVVTVVNDKTDYESRIAAGAAIFNVAAAAHTAAIVADIRKNYPDFPIIATGGPTPESIKATVAAGANAITWTPPSQAEIFAGVMAAYRKGDPHP